MDLIGYALLWGFMFPSNGKTLKEQTQLEVKRLDLHLKKPTLFDSGEEIGGDQMCGWRPIRR